MQSSSESSLDRRHHSAWRFTISNLLLLTLGAGCLLALHQNLPHIATLVLAVLVCGVTTGLWLYSRRRTRFRPARYGVILLMLAAWTALYVASFGPASAFISKHSGREDMLAVFAPVGWLHANTPLRGPLEDYVTRWKQVTRSR